MAVSKLWGWGARFVKLSWKPSPVLTHAQVPSPLIVGRSKLLVTQAQGSQDFPKSQVEIDLLVGSLVTIAPFGGNPKMDMEETLF